ncbi:nuclear transport factor 2 family protein [Polyangium aurulentum]|uniref:nuclear transport factor 2 family protein n=1 Tax=Polyangium aurulentum TaxID=2567896 RepID=UPI0010ADAAD9|nr:nuclear transport factor 2 family protein [Polyangium aurulentum]UQA57884.1 ester cyclase [Polyangium aurulentum]
MSSNEQVIRGLYQVAEVQDAEKFVSLFTDDGVFYDVSAGVKYRGKDIGKTVEIYATAFPDMHRELYDLHVSGDVVVVELSLNGTHKGPLKLPAGTIPPTGKQIHAPCCDVFRLKDGKVQSFNCYTAATILLGQLGVLTNLEGALER